MMQFAVKGIEEEVRKGEAANPDKVESLLLTLGGMADDIFEVTANTLANPALGIATAIRLIAQKAKEEKKKRDAGGKGWKLETRSSLTSSFVPRPSSPFVLQLLSHSTICFRAQATMEVLK